MTGYEKRKEKWLWRLATEPPKYKPMVWCSSQGGGKPDRWFFKVPTGPKFELKCGPGSEGYAAEYQWAVEETIRRDPKHRFSVEFSALRHAAMTWVGREPLPQPKAPPPPWHAELVRYAPSAEERKRVPGVYFAQALEFPEKFIKIGYADHTPQRVREWACGCPSKILVLGIAAGPRELERQIQGRFEKHRAIREWFRPAEEILQFIENGYA